jgi:hypothetical protein
MLNASWVKKRSIKSINIYLFILTACLNERFKRRVVAADNPAESTSISKVETPNKYLRVSSVGWFFFL